jgi:hypothetical protein
MIGHKDVVYFYESMPFAQTPYQGGPNSQGKQLGRLAKSFCIGELRQRSRGYLSKAVESTGHSTKPPRKSATRPSADC